MENKASDFYKFVLDDLPAGYVKLRMRKNNKGSINGLGIIESNRYFSMISGIKKEHLPGLELQNLLPAVYQKIVALSASDKAFCNNRHNTSFETKSEANGKWYMLTLTCYVPDLLVMIINDITQRKNAEKELKNSEQRFKSLYENSTIGLYRTTPEGQIIMANPALLKILGYSDLKELLLKNLEKEGFDPEYPRNHFKSVMEAEGEIRGLEAQWTRKDGIRIFIRESARAVRDRSGKILYYEGTVEDITERKIAEMQVSELNDIFLELGIDPQLNIDVIVRKACKILKGYFSIYMQVDLNGEKAEVMSSHNAPPSILPCLPDFFDRLSGIETDGAREYLPASVVKTGSAGFQKECAEKSWIACSFSVDRNDRKLMCVFFDAEKLFTPTEKKIISTLSKALSLEEKLKKAKTETEHANKSKNQFLANMSHEVRTPLHAILGFSEMLSASEENPGKKQMIRFIENSGSQLLYLMNDLLDLSQIEAGKVKVELGNFNPAELVIESLGYFHKQAEEKGITLKLDMSAWTKVTVNSDPYKVRQIVVNLVSNAIKFTDRGSVTVTMSNTPSKGNFTDCYIEVSDTGKGIDPKYFAIIFDEFRQLENYLTKKEKGAGLGLTIVKKLVELLNGTIEVESEPGKGSSFVVKLPMQISVSQIKQPMEQKQEKPSQKAIKILLAEDNQPIRFLIKSYGKSRGWNITEAVNGKEALESFGNQEYDIILMDVQMPVMDGYQATSLIREKEKQTGQHTPILALTANAGKPDMEKCFEAGMDDYLAKPFEKQDLIDKITALVNSGA
ncbi:MAG: response regulator [Bacteroidales bacterium]|nr:response regulator [Bacteroidales bacterium]